MTVESLRIKEQEMRNVPKITERREILTPERQEILRFIQEGIQHATERRHLALTRKANAAANFQKGRIDAFYSMALKLGFSSQDVYPDIARIIQS